jgi:hypothetical protein
MTATPAASLPAGFQLDGKIGGMKYVHVLQGLDHVLVDASRDSKAIVNSDKYEVLAVPGEPCYNNQSLGHLTGCIFLHRNRLHSHLARQLESLGAVGLHL